MARDQVFISYSHKDKDWLERLQTMLVPLARTGFKIWADTDIKPGEEWKKIIEQVLTRTKVAVLLVSPDFLASRFIHENELLPLLEEARKGGLTILWIPVRPSLYWETEIDHYQAVYDPKTPLSLLNPAHQEAALIEIARKIKDAFPNEATIAMPISPLPQIPARPALPVIQNIHGWPAQQVQELQQQTALALGLKVEFRDALKDGSPGPEMVVIPAGEFLMGSPENEPGRDKNESPQHQVVIAKPFAIGRYAVTFEEYDRFCEATRREKPNDAAWGRSRQPVINVSWKEVVAYCAWLSQETGASYRLPSEAEWEYAARAGTTTAYWWGNEVAGSRTNCGSQGKTVPVDTFQPNPFGLYQVHGNVLEWVLDKWHDNYKGAPADGSVWVEAAEAADEWRVLRGGSCGNEPGRLRGAARDGCYLYYGSAYRGFRLARTFP